MTNLQSVMLMKQLFNTETSFSFNFNRFLKCLFTTVSTSFWIWMGKQKIAVQGSNAQYLSKTIHELVTDLFELLSTGNAT